MSRPQPKNGKNFLKAGISHSYLTQLLIPDSPQEFIWMNGVSSWPPNPSLLGEPDPRHVAHGGAWCQLQMSVWT